MIDRFEKIFEYLLKVEGGYSNDKHDKGGETTWGIIESEARKHGYKGDMRDFPKEMAKDIYRKDYYDKNRLNEVKDDRVALSICDFIVNSGTWGAKKVQQVLNRLGFNLAVDGRIGKMTLEALNSVDSDKFLKFYHEKQREFYNAIVSKNSTQKKFLKGWLNRMVKKEEYIKNNF